MTMNCLLKVPEVLFFHIASNLLARDLGKLESLCTSTYQRLLSSEQGAMVWEDVVKATWSPTLNQGTKQSFSKRKKGVRIKIIYKKDEDTTPSCSPPPPFVLYGDDPPPFLLF